MSLPNAFVTLLTTSAYLPGALVLLHALRDLHPGPRNFKIVALVTPETVDAKTIGELRKAGYDLVIGVEPIGSGRAGSSALNLMAGRPDLNFALTKIHLFRLYPFFSTLIYLDADVLPIRPLDHLFESTHPHVLSACPDTGWPDCFNSGVMVVRPRETDWEGLRGLLKDGEAEDGIYREGNGSFDGADQGLLNEWFSEEGGGGDWHRLPFTYNVTPSAAYTYAPAYKRYGHKISNVHFIGPNKPWASVGHRPAGVSNVQGKEKSFDYPSLIDRWFAVYDAHIRPSSAQHPDIRQRFVVPEHIAIWNQSPSSPSFPADAPDRLDLSELKAASTQGVLALKPGQYTSLPLEGRVDLIMPKPHLEPKPKPASVTPPAEDPSALSSPPIEAAPPPASITVQTTQPAVWDAQRSSPPKEAKPEMAVSHSYYPNAWESSPSQQSSYYSHSEKHIEPDYPTLPASVVNDSWYARFSSSVPDRKQLAPVFPWEERGHPRPQRVFPKGEEPLPRLVQGLRPPSISIQNPSPPTYPTSSSSSLPTEQRSPSPPTRIKSMQESMASYKNAWDELPEIGRYMQRVGGGKEVRGGHERVRSLGSVPGTPRGALGGFNLLPVAGTGVGGGGGGGSGRKGKKKEDRKGSQVGLEDSADGDDEVSTSDGEDATPPSQGQYANNARYRDRCAQTDRVRLVDEKIGVGEGAGLGTSPVVRTLPLPSRGGGGEGGAVAFPRHGEVSLTSGGTAQGPGQGHKAAPQPAYNFDLAQTQRQRTSPPSSSLGLAGFGGPYSSSSGGSSFPSSGTGNGNGNRNGRTGSTRVWDPSTDVDARRRDSQEVLQRFVRAAMGQEEAGR
ncbi:hypothetical protein L198_07777 [Cryptococcus wingfieldii CBS 7118]|uniref:Glycogenin glucosyltransferase n=1 Tax=Cryptococcus wingfieldii CBS 7118 TaxID=1295528 RepID=A0A1E3HY69_9TREE|nr:hypothetical protein L198_07777 [Cryptococcus wingfieldii CBS 7118]ODN81293.1 hypothetical protein L198_07777 [Cryptococcus wingfieldii CBS 7118]